MPVRVLEYGANLDRTGLRIDAIVDEVERHLVWEAVFTRETDAGDRARSAPEPQRARFVDVHIDVKRVDRDHGREWGRQARANQVSRGDQETPDSSGNRRTHERVVQVQLGGIDGGAGDLRARF